MQNNKKLKRGTLWDIKKFSEKKSHSVEKNQKGGVEKKSKKSNL